MRSRIEIQAVGEFLVISDPSQDRDCWYKYFWREAIMRNVRASLPNAVVEIDRVTTGELEAQP